MALLMALMRGRRGWLLLAVATSGAAVGVTLLWNAQLSILINTVSVGQPLVGAMLARALGIMALTAATSYAKAILSSYACELLAHDLRVGYARHFTAKSALEIENLNAGEQVSKLQNETAEVCAFLGMSLFALLDDGLRFLGTFAWLLILNPTLTLAANGPTLLVMAYVFFSSKVISAATRRSQQARGQMNGFADTLLSLFPILRLYDASGMLIGGYESQVQNWQREEGRAERIRARLMSLSAMLSSMPLLLLLGVGGGMAIAAQLSIGTLYIFINLSGNVSGVMRNMPGHVAAFRRFMANMERLAPQITLSQRRMQSGHTDP